MPEGDTVYRAARRIDAALAGRVLTSTDFRVPAHATTDLAGHTVRGTRTHGKHLFTDLVPPGTTDSGPSFADPVPAGTITLHTHLKMEGTWLTYRLDDGRPRGGWSRPAFTARVVLESDDRQAVGFALGVVALMDQDGVAQVRGPLGPDLLHPGFDADEALRRLRSEGELPFVQVVQNQRLMAGLGNMYTCELAFLTGTHPLTPFTEAHDHPRIVARARQLLEQNVTRGIQSTTGVLAPGRNTWVYRQKACRRCGTRVRITKIGYTGQERTTYWCPRCQPER